MKTFKEFLRKRRIAAADADKARIEAKKRQRPESYWTTGPGRPNQTTSNTSSSGDMWNNQTWNNM
jgi:hypothetical protein